MHPLESYVEKHYPSGKRDLYAAFILRCLELCQPNGRVAMVTMQSWMFFSSFIDLRSIPNETISEIVQIQMSLRVCCVRQVLKY